MPKDRAPAESARRGELLELAYQYVLERGLAGVSLRPLATAVGSSPRVLLFLFGSKDELVRALLARARTDELDLLERLRQSGGQRDLAGITAAVWEWLAEPEHRALLRLWAEAYAQSLIEPEGPWAGFAQATVDDWLALLASAQPPAVRRTKAGLSQRTLALAVLRGALLDLLATDDAARTTAAVQRHLEGGSPG
jgi:AcrR family transcriptional regulator